MICIAAVRPVIPGIHADQQLSCSDFVKEFFYWYDHKKSRQNEQMEQNDDNGTEPEFAILSQALHDG